MYLIPGDHVRIKKYSIYLIIYDAVYQCFHLGKKFSSVTTKYLLTNQNLLTDQDLPHCCLAASEVSPSLSAA